MGHNRKLRRQRNYFISAFFCAAILFGASPQRAAIALARQSSVTPSPADILRGDYGPYRANYHLLSYNLDIRVDPDKKLITGTNTISFEALKNSSRIQLDLHPDLRVDGILFDGAPLKYSREYGAVFIDFPEPLKTGTKYAIEFRYSGTPISSGELGGFTFDKDPEGRPWIYSACEIVGASVWWPNKEQWRDRVSSMEIQVAVPNGLVDISNGTFVGKTDLGDGYTRWDWIVHYPINNYDVAVNIGDYAHFSDRFKTLSLDYYVLPENVDRAKTQFVQVQKMLEAFQHYFGEYPFQNDGYKLIEVPYPAMEHQTAIAYGNKFQNGYAGIDWTGVGISLFFDLNIIHESAHEWFGNSVTAADRSDIWIHESWAGYLESLYVEYQFGHNDAIKYLNGYKSKVENLEPMLGQRGVAALPPNDVVFKGALFINTLRSIVNDDDRWWTLIRNFYQHFKYHTIMTEDALAYFNEQTGINLTPVFNQYLRHTAIPTLELKFNETEGSVSYRWKADEPGFAMPVKVGTRDHWQIIQPTGEWKSMKTPLNKEEFTAATDLYYINLTKQ
jgi:aminopeptidase N